MRSTYSTLLPAVMLAAILGCGPRTPKLVDVSGKVLYKSEPIARGQIRFVPKEGTFGHVSGAVITDGVYRAEGKAGVPVGTHKVEIVAFRVTKGKNAEQSKSAAPEDAVASQQLLPDKFNTRSQLELVIPEGSGPLTKDFELVD